MKKTVSIIGYVFLLLMCSIQGIKAQTLVCASEIIEYGSYELPNNINAQKIRFMTSDSNKYIALSQLSNGRSAFSCMSSSINTKYYINFPSEYSITDFETLGDTLYFCGKYTGGSYAYGFIGYIAEADLVDSTKKFRFSAISQMATINKMKVYHNALNNCNTVIGIGPMRTEAKDCMVSFRANKSAVTGLNPIPQTQYNIYKCSSTNMLEVLQDIAITNNYICLVGNAPNFINSASGTYQQMYLHRFSRANPSIQITNKLILGNKPLGFSDRYHLEALNDDNIAIAHLSIMSVEECKTFCSVVYKVDLTTVNDTMQIKSASVFDITQDVINPILDISNYYNNYLLVLKKNENKSTFFTINLQNNLIFPYSASKTYASSNNFHFCSIISNRHLIPVPQPQPSLFPPLSYYHYYITLAGTDNYMSFIKAERNMTDTGVEQESCFYNTSTQVETFVHNNFTLSSNNLSLNSYPTIVAEITIPTINIYQLVSKVCTCNPLPFNE